VIVSFYPNEDELPFEEWIKQHSSDASWQVNTLKYDKLPATGKTVYTVEIAGPGHMNWASYIEWDRGFLRFEWNDIEGDTLPFWRDILHSLKELR
jgi:hypothetical protein